LTLLFAQITDCHVDDGDPESAGALAAAVDRVLGLNPPPAAVLMTGDLANDASDSEYRRVAEQLERLPMPVHVATGNHDDRAALRAHLGAPGGGDEPLQYAVEVGELRVVVCDTKVPGRDEGALGEERLAWLESTLAEAPDQPTIVAMHHPPLHLGIPVIDELALADADRLAVGEVLARNQQVQAVVAGHVHRAITASSGGRPVFVCPSSYWQLALDFSPGAQLAVIREPRAIGLHAAAGGTVTSHVLPVGDYGPPMPV
jgi:3',5'-cyclic AMP phosphodiesterase CpdA